MRERFRTLWTRGGRQGVRGSGLVWLAALALASAPLVAAGEPAGCDADHRDLCTYAPAAQYGTASITTTLTDPARGGHVVPVKIVFPLAATGARPIVFWQHGGNVKTQRPGGGYNFGSPEHARLFAEAGYVVVLVDRTPAKGVPTAAQLKICKANGAITPAACQNWYGFHVLGPTNTPFVVTYLSHLAPAQLPGFAGTLDLSRIVVGGWSGGTESVLNHAGAPQHWPGPLAQASVPVPGAVAFIGAAPRGPDYVGYGSGFDAAAYHSIGAAPFLYLLARNERPAEDGAHGGAARSPAWLGASQGDKWMSWDTVDAVTHTNLDLSECGQSAVQTDHCAWTGALTLAFVDAYVAHRQEAVDWLGSEAFRILTGGSIEAHVR